MCSPCCFWLLAEAALHAAETAEGPPVRPETSTPGWKSASTGEISQRMISWKSQALGCNVHNVSVGGIPGSNRGFRFQIFQDCSKCCCPKAVGLGEICRHPVAVSRVKAQTTPGHQGKSASYLRSPEISEKPEMQVENRCTAKSKRFSRLQRGA
jgi:hypothetical protein